MFLFPSTPVQLKMSRGGMRKALGAIKDTTTVSLAKVSSDYKDLDIAIVKATNHHERPAKERHIRAIFAYISAVRPRADVAYCIHALARRLSRTRNWAVALKTLIVIHRTLREVDPTFHEELLNFGKRKIHMLNMTHFRDDSSQNASDYSTWVRNYALFLEERLECFRVLKYDIQAERLRMKDLGVEDLLEQLPALQQLLFRILNCQPQGASVYNCVVHSALAMMASESAKIYQAINDGSSNLVDKFFEMQRSDASRALDICKRARQQAERLNEFNEMCKNLDVSRAERFTKLEQPHESFLQAMEDFVHEAPRSLRMHSDQISDSTTSASKEVLAVESNEYNKNTECLPSPPPPEPVKTKEPVVMPDLMALDDPVPTVPEVDEKHAIAALAIVPIGDQTGCAGPLQPNGAMAWDITLIPNPSLNINASVATAPNKLPGGLDKFTLDGLYDDAIRRNHQQNSGLNHWEPAVSMYGNGTLQQLAHDPYYATNMATAAHMAVMSNQQQALMLRQQTLNHFGTSYAAAGSFSSAIPAPAYNPYAGII